MRYYFISCSILTEYDFLLSLVGSQNYWFPLSKECQHKKKKAPTVYVCELKVSARFSNTYTQTHFYTHVDILHSLASKLLSSVLDKGVLNQQFTEEENRTDDCTEMPSQRWKN